MAVTGLCAFRFACWPQAQVITWMIKHGLATWAAWQIVPINMWHNTATIQGQPCGCNTSGSSEHHYSPTLSPIAPIFKLVTFWDTFQEDDLTMVTKETLSCSLLTPVLIPRESSLSLRLQIKRWNRVCENLLHCPQGPNQFTVMIPSEPADSNLWFRTNLG